MQEVKRFPVLPDEYSKEDAPYLYTENAEMYADARPYLEPRPAGTIACLGRLPLKGGPIARAWVKAGYVVER